MIARIANGRTDLVFDLLAEGQPGIGIFAAEGGFPMRPNCAQRPACRRCGMASRSSACAPPTERWCCPAGVLPTSHAAARRGRDLDE